MTFDSEDRVGSTGCKVSNDPLNAYVIITSYESRTRDKRSERARYTRTPFVLSSHIYGSQSLLALGPSQQSPFAKPTRKGPKLDALRLKLVYVIHMSLL